MAHDPDVRHVGLFAILDPTPEDLAGVIDVWQSGDWPWEYAIADNVRATGQATIPIGFKDESGSLGFYSPFTNHVNVDPVSRLGEASFRQVLAHELSHLIDDVMLDTDRKTEIHGLMHDRSPVRFEDCPATKAYTAGMWQWRAGTARHYERPNEAYAWMMPKVWCPPHSTDRTNYGPHHFTHAERIRELTMAGADDPFDDIDGSPFRDDILWLARQGIAFGHDGSFQPDRPVTRGQMAAFLRRALDRT